VGQPPVKHAAAPDNDTLPDARLEQLSATPISDVYVPAAHGEQTVEPADARKYPAGQPIVEHTLAPSGDSLPVAHVAQLEDPEVAYVPATQPEQLADEVAPVEDKKVPAGQSAQLVNDVAAA